LPNDKVGENLPLELKNLNFILSFNCQTKTQYEHHIQFPQNPSY